MAESYPPTLAAAQARIAAVRPAVWRSRASRGLQTAADLLAVNEVPAC